MSGSVEIRCERNGASRKPSENRLVSQNVVISRSFVTVCLHVKIKMLLLLWLSRNDLDYMYCSLHLPKAGQCSIDGV